MARARNIKHGFFRNEQLAALPPITRLLFAGLWTVADREGRLEDRPRRIKADVLPYDDCDVEALLTELEDSGFVQRYAADGQRYIQILTFARHQNPHRNEAPSTIPAPESRGPRTDAVPELTGARHAPIPERPGAHPDPLPENDAVGDDAAPEPGGASIGVAPDGHRTARADALIPDSESLKTGGGAGDGEPRARTSAHGQRALPHHLPDTFAVTTEMRRWATTATPFGDAEIDAETDKFRDYFTSAGATKADWVAAWRSWLRREIEFRARRPAGRPTRATAERSWLATPDRHQPFDFFATERRSA